MSYIAAYLFYMFKKKEIAFQFMSFIVEERLAKYFTGNLDGLLKLSFIIDKYLEKNYGLIWYRFSKGNFSSLHFSISLLLSVFTCYISSNSSLHPFVDRMWDMCILGGFPMMIHQFIEIISLQQNDILSLHSDMLLHYIKRIENHPFGIRALSRPEESAQIPDLLASFISESYLPEIANRKFELEFEELGKCYDTIKCHVIKIEKECSL